MIPLQTQDQFESLVIPRALPTQIQTATKYDPFVIVYFTASWCGACQRLNQDRLQQRKDIKWYKCDIDQNRYTLGYCGLKQIPSFAFIKNGKFIGAMTTSITENVLETIEDTF
jgi:thioredoxin-like negative regulator of GroEL